jgi:hypothetical protein
LYKTAALKKELFKPVVLNYIKYYIEIKKNCCGLYASKKEVINHYNICDNRVAFIKTCLSKVDLSLAFFIKSLKKRPLKDFITHINNYN